MVEDRIQDLNSVTCGIFQLYFYNYLIRTKTAKYRTKINLNKKTIETLLNERFVLGGQDKNEENKTIR